MIQRIVPALVALLVVLGGLVSAQPAPTPFPFSPGERNVSPPSNERPYRPIPLDAPEGRPEAPDILGQIAGCDLDGARVLFVYNVAKAGDLNLPIELPRKTAPEGERRTLIVGDQSATAPAFRDRSAANQQYLRLIDIAQSLFSNIFLEAGLTVVANPEMAQLLYDSPARREAIASERAFYERARSAALTYNAEYIFIYYVDFKDVGYSGTAQNWHDVQDTLIYEMHRVADGLRVSGRPFRAAGRSDVDFEDAHYQNMQRLVDVGLDGDLGIQVLRDVLRFCRRAGTRGDMVTVGLYYQGTDPSPIAIGRLLSEVLRSREINESGNVRRRESRAANGEAYQEYAIQDIGTVDELEDFLYTNFVVANSFEDRFIANFSGSGTTLVIELLDELRGGNWSSSALNPANQAATQAAQARADREARPLSVVEITRLAERGTVLVEAVGTDTQPAAGVLLTHSGIVVTDSTIGDGARQFRVHFPATADRPAVVALASAVVTLDNSKLLVLQVDGEFKLPEGVEPLPLGDSDKVQEHDPVYAAAPRTARYPTARGRAGSVERIQRGVVSEIVHTAVLDELTNGAPLLNMRGEVIGICRLAMRATGTTIVAQQEGNSARVADELANPDQLLRRDEILRREDSAVKRQFGSAVPTNPLVAVIGAEEIEAVRKGTR
ncbi:MAG: trypsin-like peptidase domain-containing protein [Candidatus Sumerlaeia bacterium]|nr:trypsin-like peptidase domain-containing protein [Candidatus Sumerlaeia bacterium]